MFEKLKRFLQGEPPPVAAAIEDPELGLLSWSKDDEAWLSRTEHRDAGFVFQITGTPQPDATLVRHAVDILQKKEEFVLSVQHFLAAEAAVSRLRAFKAEIADLKIERVCLFWPDRSNDGMIYFHGGSEGRVWRSDYISRVPQGLGFDS